MSLFKDYRYNVAALLACGVLTLGLSASPVGAAIDQLRVQTDLGAFAVDLYDDTPIAKANILSYVDAGYYADTVFDLKGVLDANEGGSPLTPDADIIQAGSADSTLTFKSTGALVTDTSERFHSNTPGTLAMTEQFLVTFPIGYAAQWRVNINDNSHLDGDLTVFAEISKGMSVANTIWSLDAYELQTGTPFYNVPLEDLDGDTNTHLPSERVIISDIIRNGDTDEDDDLDVDDIDHLFDSFGSTDMKYDVAIDGGPANKDDVDHLVRDIFQTEYGDFNLDGQVGPGDLTIMKIHWLGTGKSWADGDTDGNGIVEPADLTNLKLFWLFGTGLGPAPTPAPAPEPATAVLLALGGAALLRRRR